MSEPVLRTDAEVQFTTSSIYPKPANWTGPVFEIKVDFPKPKPHAPGVMPALPLPEIPVNEPWKHVDFKKHPGEYAKIVKEYCWEGNVNNDFDIHKNTVNNWYHAPWMHASSNGREPLKGLTFERAIPRLEFAKTQTHAQQSWAIGFYNAPGGSVFGGVWADPNAPLWANNLAFPKGTCTYKLLFSTATDEQIPTMKGSPKWPAVISPQPNPDKAPGSGEHRNTFASDVRLIQVDWAVVDDRSPIGWVFGTFMYNGNLKDTNPWDRITAVGVMWGNDPELTQAAHDGGKRPVESWINPEAETLRKQLGGSRPSWGWNGRLNGPADNFISACTSCHGTAQSHSLPMVQDGHFNREKQKWEPLNQKLTMTWFENVKAGEPFSVRGALSADYSLQFVIGWNNYNVWRAKNQPRRPEPDPRNKVVMALPGRRVTFKAKDEHEAESHKVADILSRIVFEQEPLRAGPELNWE